MSNLAKSDWILAERFVDGDLPAAEVAQVKSRISADAEFAAAVEETRQQSSLFSALPNFKASDDLRDRTVQASLDQVKAIMGAWPVENNAATTTKPASVDRFDWKSTVALVASLAGVLVIGTMLWNGSSDEPGVAMDKPESSQPFLKNSAVASETEQAFEVDETSIPQMPAANANEDISIGKGGFDAKSFNANQGFAAKKQTTKGGPVPEATKALPEMGPMFGTPMKTRKSKLPPFVPQRKETAEFALNSSAPVEQIWYVSQDRTMSKDTVSEILNLNQIKVQREKPPKSAFSITEPVEAFYVAATPNQIMLAMSQISNNADIEMIQLPSATDSPIADVIANQFASSNSAFADKNSKEQQANKPPRFEEPASQALAQQLFSNKLPRNFEPTDAVPKIVNVPPILNSDSPITGFEAKKDGELAVQSKSEAASNSIAADSDAPKSAPNFDVEPGGFGGGGSAGSMSRGKAAPNRARQSPQAAQQSQAKNAGQSPVDNGQQLRQYLILVRGGEGED